LKLHLCNVENEQPSHNLWQIRNLGREEGSVLNFDLPFGIRISLSWYRYHYLGDMRNPTSVVRGTIDKLVILIYASS
jgi:hypothetical protein